MIQRVGREAVVEQALRDSLPEWYEQALLDSGVVAGRRPEARRRRPARRGRGRSSSRSRSACGRRPSSASGKGLEVGRADVEVPDDAVDAELDRLREGFASLAPVERAARRPATPRDRLLGDDRRRAVRGLRHAATSCSSSATETLLAGVRRRAHRRHRAGRARRSRSRFPDDHQPEELAGQDRELRRSRSRRCGRRTCPSSTTTSPPRPRSSRPSPSSATRSAGASPRASSSAPRPSSARPPSTRSPRTRSSRSRTTSSTPAPTRCGSGSSASSRRAGSTPQTYAQMQGKDRHDLINDAEEDAERGAAARGGARRRRRRRGDRGRPTRS